MSTENGSVSDDSPEVRALLRAGISDEVDYDFEAGLSTHLAAIGAVPMAPHPAGAPGAAAAGTPSAAAGLSGKALFALLGIPLASATVVAALWLHAGTKEHAPGPQPEPAEPNGATIPLLAPAPVPVASVVAAPSAPLGGVPPADVPEAADRSTRTLRHAANPHRTLTLAEAADGAESAAAAPKRGSTSDQAIAAPVADSSATAPSGGSAPASTADEQTQPATKPDDLRQQAQERLAREMDQLVQAKRALSDDPRQALLLAERGQREFPHSVFAEERQQILLLALIGVGRVDDARRLAAPYLQSHPDSPFARRVQKALSGAPAR